jgi:hypothetical protein
MDDPFLDPILARWDAAVRGARSDDLPSLIARTGTVLRDGAPAEVIDALEARLGTRLPPSYRAFLERSDGAFAQPGWGIITSYRRDEGCERDTGLGLLDCSRVGWFRDRERSYVDIWADTPAEIAEDGTHSGYRSIPEQQYLDHERHRDSVHLKSGHVRYALQISSDIDGYTILLNPLVVGPRDEWEAWDFGSKLPGAIPVPVIRCPAGRRR